MTIENVTCPICGGPMVSRANGATGQRFWGCKKYPTCRGTRNTDGEAPPGAPRKPAWNGPTDDPELPSDRARQADRGRWRRS